MAYDPGLAQRLRELFAERPDTARHVYEKAMFGGIAFMARQYMVVGILGDALMARVGADNYEQALTRPHARPMDFTGRPMKGFVVVDPPGFSADADLHRWIDLCMAFNASLPDKGLLPPKPKRSKKPQASKGDASEPQA